MQTHTIGTTRPPGTLCCRHDHATLVEDDEAEAEARALAVAIAKSYADPRTVPREEVRVWLLRLANGEFDASPPEPRGRAPVLWRARALADIGRITNYIAVDNPVSIQRVGRELLLVADSLAIFPRRRRPGRQAGARELVTIGPFILVYRIADTEAVMTVLGVWHAAQDRP